MKKRKQLVLLFVLVLSCLMIRCDCCPICSDSRIDITHLSPEDRDTLYSQYVTLKWDSRFYTFGSEYLRISVTSVTPGVIFDSVQSLPFEDSTFTIGPLEWSTTYSWHLYGSGISDDISGRPVSETTDDWYFTISDLPGTLSNPTPDSGAVNVSLNPTFSWDVHNPDLTPFDFNIYLGATTDPPLLQSGLSAPSFSYLDDALEFQTQYYWRAEAYYGGDTISSPLWTFETIYMLSDQIFTLLEIDVQQTPSRYHIYEEVRARFDAGAAIDAPIYPLQADSVYCEGIRLDWQVSTNNYSYAEFSMPFIENGEMVDFTVYGNGTVPNLDYSHLFPQWTLEIISPESFDVVSINGFDVTWDGGSYSGNVWLILMSGNDSTGVIIETENDGSYTFSSGDLAPLGGQTGSYDLILLRREEATIDKPEYRSESLLRIRVYCKMEQINILSVF